MGKSIKKDKKVKKDKKCCVSSTGLRKVWIHKQ